MKIFITGGLGYLGSALAKEAVKKGHSVVLYDLLIYNQDLNRILKEISPNGIGVKFIRGDTRDKEFLKKLIKKTNPSFVFHFGELVGYYACKHDPELTKTINFYGTKNVIDICSELNIPLLYNSSSSVYGNQKDGKLMKETDKLPNETELDVYCKYKLLIESYIKKKKNINPKFQVIVFRPATVGGPSPRMRVDLLPNHFIYCALAKGKIKVAEQTSCRAIIDIKDVISAYLKVINKKNWEHLIYNVGSHNLQKIEYAKMIQKVTDCKLILTENIGDSRNLKIDCSLLENEFSFKPNIKFDHTINNVKSWMEKNREKIEKSGFIGVINTSLTNWLSML